MSICTRVSAKISFRRVQISSTTSFIVPYSYYFNECFTKKAYRCSRKHFTTHYELLVGFPAHLMRCILAAGLPTNSSYDAKCFAHYLLFLFHVRANSTSHFLRDHMMFYDKDTQVTIYRWKGKSLRRALPLRYQFYPSWTTETSISFLRRIDLERHNYCYHRWLALILCASPLFGKIPTVSLRFLQFTIFLKYLYAFEVIMISRASASPHCQPPPVAHEDFLWPATAAANTLNPFSHVYFSSLPFSPTYTGLFLFVFLFT